MTPALTFFTPGQPPSTETISTSFVLAGRLQRLVGAGRGRLVDRVDDVDVRVLLQQVLHRRAAAFLGAAGDVVADDARVVLVAVLASGSFTSMPKPSRKPWSRS